MCRLLLLTVIALLSVPAVGRAQTAWREVSYSIGCSVFQKGREATYIVSTDLNRARLVNLYGSPTGAPNAMFARKSLAAHWTDAARMNSPESKAYVVVNGAFFDLGQDPTPLSFGLKSGGRVLSYGSDTERFRADLLTLAFDSGRKTASISGYSRSTFDSTTPDIVGGLTTAAATYATGTGSRTLVGVNRNLVYLYVTHRAVTTRTASDELKGFGAQAVMLLDGGGSTGLIVNGTATLSTTRLLPHSLAVFAGR